MSNKEVTDQLLHINRILTDGRLDDSEARYQAGKLVIAVLISLDNKFVA